MSYKNNGFGTSSMKQYLILHCVTLLSFLLASCSGGNGTTQSVPKGVHNIKQTNAVSSGTNTLVPSFELTPDTNFRTYNPDERVILGEVSGTSLIRGEIGIYLRQASDLNGLKTWVANKGYDIVYIGGLEIPSVIVDTKITTEAQLNTAKQEIRALLYVKSTMIIRPVGVS